MATERSRGKTAVLGVLGGIASGKSLAAELLAGPNGRVIDADRLVGELYGSPEFLRELREHFGDSAIDASGRADRKAIAARVFATPAERVWLESRIHPRVRERIAEELERAERDRIARVVLDIPLLLENDAQHGLVARCDALVFVESDPRARDRRANENRGWKVGEVARREAAQLPLEAKRTRADAVIDNRGDRAALEREVARVLAELGLET